jgi:hypothetical protein
MDEMSLQDRPGREVVVLGAGFSRAISASLPLTDELGQLAVEEAEARAQKPIPHPVFQDGNFEAWLSGLAEDQPYLSTAANLENRALFLRVSEGIRSVLTDRELAALSSEAPAWLFDLLSVLHARRATVLSVNYDNLIECAVDSHYLYDWPATKRVTAADVLNDLPPSPNSVGQPSALAASTFRLLKLHGSLSWYWSPDDTTGATLQRWSNPGTFGAPAPIDEALRRRILPGREPFIVPPAATKSGYYRNPVTREIWSQAFEALRAADRIVLIGYSLPAADLTLSGMIADAAVGREVTIDIVNPEPEPVRGRLTRLGIGEHQFEQPEAGIDCVEQFACRYRDQQAQAVLDYLRAWGAQQTIHDGTVILSWGNLEAGRPGLVQPVITLGDPSRQAGELVLSAQGVQGTPIAPKPSQLGELIAHLPTTKRLVGLTADGRQLTIVALWSRAQPGSDKIRWVSLVPSGRPSSA